MVVATATQALMAEFQLKPAAQLWTSWLPLLIELTQLAPFQMKPGAQLVMVELCRTQVPVA